MGGSLYSDQKRKKIKACFPSDCFSPKFVKLKNLLFVLKELLSFQKNIIHA